MADLEREYGWEGLAAHHYTRVVALDRKALHGRPEVVLELSDLAGSPDWDVDPKPAISLGDVRAEGALGRFVVEVLGMVRARGRAR